MYEDSCNLMYDMISQRIKIKRDFLNLKNKDICPEGWADPSLISAIIHNRRNDKKNKYLIPDGSSAGNDSKTYAESIAEHLGFNSPVELLIGDEEEIEAYGGYLFYLLITDALKTGNNIIKDAIEDLCSDYIPYALFSAYNEKKIEYEEEVDLEQFIKPKYISNELDWDLATRTAIERLYKLHKTGFNQKFKNMFIKQPNMAKIDRRFSKLVNSELVPMMKENRITNPYIDEVKEQLRRGFDEIVKNTFDIAPFSPEAEQHTCEDPNAIKYDTTKWFLSYLDYVNALSDVQIKDEGLSIGKLLDNKWNSGMCL